MQSAEDSQVLLCVQDAELHDSTFSLDSEPTPVPSVCSTVQKGEGVPWGAILSPPLLAWRSKLILPSTHTLVLW